MYGEKKSAYAGMLEVIVMTAILNSVHSIEKELVMDL